MISIEPTTDQNYIESVFLNPDIYAQMKDDSCPDSPALLAGADIKSIPGFFLKVIVDGVAAGCYWLIWKGTEVEAHTALLENCRGRAAIVATVKAIRWVFSHTSATAITSYAWSDSPAVAWFCAAVGMERTETKAWPNTRSGHEVAISYFSIQREAI